MILTNRYYYPVSTYEKAICFAGRLRFCHVDGVFPLGNEWITFESSFPHGVRIKKEPWGTYPLHVEYRKTMLRCTPEELMAWINRSMHGKNSNYGTVDCVQAFIRRWTGWKIGGNPGGRECAEYQAAALRENGGMDVDARYGLTPDELYDAQGAI